VGQDQQYLGALIVPNLEAFCSSGQLPKPASASTRRGQGARTRDGGRRTLTLTEIDFKLVQRLIPAKLNRKCKNRPGYRPDDTARPFQIILSPFRFENGMTDQTLIRRNVGDGTFSRDIGNGMFADTSPQIQV